MEIMEIKKLKSGSDFRGTAIETNTEKVNLDVETVKVIASSFALWVAKTFSKSELAIAVGHDSRLTSPTFKDAIVQELSGSGISVYDCSLASTPSMFAMTKHEVSKCDGSIMITASHHPYQKNGLKFFTPNGGLSGKDIDGIIAIAESGEKFAGTATDINKADYVGIYADTLVELVRKSTGETEPLKGFKIVVDAGNGAGGFYAEKVLAPLGADTDGSQFLDPNGNFPNHVPNPEDEDAMKSISECVVKNKADLGLIFDTDVDRAAVVDSSGQEINRNKLIALIGAILLKEHPGTYVVTDSVTSSGLKTFIESLGGKHYRYKRGYNNVIGKARELTAEGEDAQLAIETSGHAALKENDYLDDGAYLVTRIIIEMAKLKKEGKTLESLIETLVEPQSRFETRIKFIDQNDFKAYGTNVIEKLTEFSTQNFTLETSTYEGIRANVAAQEGWYLLRQSVHDPIMVLNIESDNESGAKNIAKIVYDFVTQFDNLDCEALKKFAN